MAVDATFEGGRLQLRFSGDLTIYQAQEDHAALRAVMAGAEPVFVDLSSVTEIDSAGVQILLALREQARRQGREFSLGPCSPAVINVFRLFRLEETLCESSAARLSSGGDAA
jgi:anti-anti-sigma factor